MPGTISCRLLHPVIVTNFIKNRIDLSLIYDRRVYSERGRQASKGDLKNGNTNCIKVAA